jgi:hypothetical protein
MSENSNLKSIPDNIEDIILRYASGFCQQSLDIHIDFFKLNETCPEKKYKNHIMLDKIIWLFIAEQLETNNDLSIYLAYMNDSDFYGQFIEGEQYYHKILPVYIPPFYLKIYLELQKKIKHFFSHHARTHLLRLWSKKCY